jgi:opacity protein-like surface antigen
MAHHIARPTMRVAAVAALCLCAVPVVYAQAQGGFGIKGGLSYGNVSNGGLLPGENKTRTGFALGVGLSSATAVGFGIEALYAQRGVSARRLDYIDVPVYLRIALPVEAVSPFAYAGPQASFEIRCRSDGADCPDTDRPNVSYAGVIGAGLRLGTTSAFTVEGRYIYGLTDLKLNTVTSSESYKTRSFMVLLGIGF